MIDRITEAVNAAREMYPDFFVYRGGHHVAIHRQSKTGYVNPGRLCFALENSNDITLQSVSAAFIQVITPKNMNTPIKYFRNSNVTI